MARKERDVRFEGRMSDHEALMWNVEKDPWLNPNGAAVIVLDRPPDVDLLRRRMIAALPRLPRLMERVAPGLGRLSPPAWVIDPEFNLDYHLRHTHLPAPGTERQLLDLAALLYEDPFDRTRPLWTLVVIDGLASGRSALFSKIHHTVADGIGTLRMSEAFQELSRDDDPPPDLDLDAVIADAVATRPASPAGLGGDLGENLTGTAARSVRHVMRRQLGAAQRALGEVAVWPADPRRPAELAAEAAETVRSTAGTLTSRDNRVPGGSPLWHERSRQRHLEWIRVSLEDLREACHALGGSVNDGFMTGIVEGAVRYHTKRDAALEALNMSFVISTRHDGAVGGNAFTPQPVQVLTPATTVADRFAQIHATLGAKRDEVGRTGGRGMSLVAGVANLLPTSVVTRAARAQAAKLDIATSNLRGAPFPVYVSGAKVLANIPIGPVAGTAANITALSYDGNLDMGMLCDPKAIDDPADLRNDIADAFDELIKTA